MGALGFKAVSMTQLAVSNDAHDHKGEAGYSGCERNLPSRVHVRDAQTSYRAPPRSCRSTYHPAWGAGTLASDVVAGTPILAGAAQLTVSPVAPRWAELLAAAWGSRGVRGSCMQIRSLGPSAAGPKAPGLPRS